MPIVIKIIYNFYYNFKTIFSYKMSCELWLQPLPLLHSKHLMHNIKITKAETMAHHTHVNKNRSTTHFLILAMPECS